MASRFGGFGLVFKKHMLQSHGGVQLGAQSLAPLISKRLFSDDSKKVEYTSEYFSRLVKNKPLVVFMKGDPSAPMCGFSRLVVQILHMHGMERFDHYDVLDDADFKDGMKSFSNWPTFPQVYVDGELVGGADILMQMHQSGELILELKKIGHKSVLLEKDQPATT